MTFDISRVKFNPDGLVPAIIQDASSGRVLMMAWMNLETLKMSIELKETVFFSRSRNEIWRKGLTSGNAQTIVTLELDCDGDTILIKVRPAGPACHTGSESCFDSYVAEGLP